MKIEAPCRLGERFSCKKAFLGYGRFVLTGLDFFAWSTPGMQGVTLFAKMDPKDKDENTSFFYPTDPEDGVHISFEIPDAIIKPGYQLRELGLDTDAVGHLQGARLTENGWDYIIYYGKDYGGPWKAVRTEELDELFRPVLPLHAVQVDLEKYLI